jgi:hypothetical protein
MRHEAEVLHQIPGRARIRVNTAKGDADTLARIAERLSALASVQEVAGNPVTGSLLIKHVGEFAEIAVAAEKLGLFALVQGTRGPLDVQGHLNQGLRHLDRDIKSVTSGEMDFNGLLVLAFGALAIQQAIEGQVVIPAAAALWYALGAAQRPKEQASASASSKKGEQQRTER